MLVSDERMGFSKNRENLIGIESFCLNSMLKQWVFWNLHAFVNFSLYYQGLDTTTIFYYPNFLHKLPFFYLLEDFTLIFSPRICIVSVSSSLILDHTVLPDLLQCTPSPRISDILQGVKLHLATFLSFSYNHHMVFLSQSVLSWPSSCSPLPLCSVHEATWRSFNCYGSWCSWREHYYPLMDTGKKQFNTCHM